MRILIIGKNSFIGKNFIKHSQFDSIECISVRDISPNAIEYSKFDTIIHLAAIVHQQRKISMDEYKSINTDLPINIALLAKKAGVKQFVFMSTVSVYGVECTPNYCINEQTQCNPLNGYGISKLNAENKLQKLNSADFIVSIIRPPLVYGEQVKANMLSLIKLIDNFSILPFAGINNLRSFIAVKNLISFLDKVIEKRADGVFLACDSRPISTTELINQIAHHLNKRIFLFKTPNIIKRIGCIFVPSIFNKLFESYIINNTISIKALNYIETNSIEDSIKEMVQNYTIQKNKSL